MSRYNQKLAAQRKVIMANISPDGHLPPTQPRAATKSASTRRLPEESQPVIRSPVLQAQHAKNLEALSEFNLDSDGEETFSPRVIAGNLPL